ncbi:MAG: LPS biosynthesis glycosyltransferase [Hydrococcus sp. CRU_1_1]|nr:LPS biosynthesis glycosyltransferase [Hydrococcus sp. CRU_1_1]NJQ97419.1 LPS biosynthesis glycosyltransferase [Hydrococcus sp. CSU_1_8]
MTIQLRDRIERIFIIAYKESTELLEEAFQKEGIPYEVIRQKHQPDYKNYSSSYLCLLNHKQAWERATRLEKLTLIVEADFVPVIGIGKLPIPFNPDNSDVGIAWLYTCAPQIYSVSEEGFAQGFSTSMVAYLVTSLSAQYLIELADEIKEKIGATNYSTWDSNVDSFLRARKLKNYVPFRNYGEHGGIPNPEHSKNGLSATHRADILYGKLAFMPLYATDRDRGQNYFSVRLQARLKGLARLAMGKYLRLPVLKGSSVPHRLLGFAVRRQLSVKL